MMISEFLPTVKPASFDQHSLRDLDYLSVCLQTTVWSREVICFMYFLPWVMPDRKVAIRTFSSFRFATFRLTSSFLSSFCS
jgi:hypothetical protein